MARKSRRQTQNTLAAVAESNNIATAKERINTAAYARLSVEKETDESIETQITMLYQYIAGHSEYDLIDTYADNGHTGTDFDRPEFNRMMDDVRAGKIQCIIVKDLSRFGRNLVETGYYLETLLPKLNVRLIAINDDFDSSREEDRNSLAVPIKNLVNEMYSKDFSRKATSYYELHSQRGDAKILNTIYGYNVDRENNVLVPNPETAPIVQVIFRWYLSGCSLADIVKRLKLIGVMTPECYKRLHNGNNNLPATDRWKSERVRNILVNPSYIGDTIHGKRRKTLYKNIPAHKTPKEEWIVHHHTHPSLISDEDFNKAQEMFESVCKSNTIKKIAYQKNRELYKDFFPQKVVCADCGNTMQFQRYSHDKRSSTVDGAYYMCCGDDITPACRKRIYSEYLRLVVVEQIRRLGAAISGYKSVIEDIQAGRADNSARRSLDAKLNHVSYKVAELDEKLTVLYENFAEGIVDAEDYQMMKERYQGERAALQKRSEELCEEKRKMEKDILSFLEMEKDLSGFLKEHSSHEELIDKFVEKVYISGDDRIEICFCCDDILERIKNMTEVTEERSDEV